MPLALVRGEELQHLLVVGVPVARERVADDPRQVEVPDRDRVGRAVRTLEGLRRRPGADARNQLSLAIASGRSIAAASSMRRATRTARRIVAERLESTPARCHSQDGTSDQVLASGIT